MKNLEKQKIKEEEEMICKEITQNGERLGLSWWRYEGEYYQIFGNTLRYAKQKDIKINATDAWYILSPINTNACIVYISGFERVLNGVHPDDVIIYKDKYFAFKKTVWELWRYDSHVVSADTITRLTDVLWSLSSNGIYFLSNLDSRYTRPIGKYPLHIDEDNVVYYVDEFGVRQNVKITEDGMNA